MRAVTFKIINRKFFSISLQFSLLELCSIIDDALGSAMTVGNHAQWWDINRDSTLNAYTREGIFLVAGIMLTRGACGISLISRQSDTISRSRSIACTCRIPVSVQCRVLTLGITKQARVNLYTRKKPRPPKKNL